MLASTESTDQSGGNVKVEQNVRITATKRAYLISKVDLFFNYLKGCAITKECKDVAANLQKFRSCEAILGLVVNYKSHFQMNEEATVQNWMQHFGFERSH